MTESQQPKKKRGLDTRYKRVVRFSYEVLSGQLDPPWVKKAPEAVQRAYRAGQQAALQEIIEALFPRSDVFNVQIWKTSVHNYAKEVKDPRLNR